MDDGGENVRVQEFMNLHRGEQVAEPCRIVKSVRNARIERLWKDVRKDVLQTFRDHFYFLEYSTAFNVELAYHIYLFCNRTR